MRFSCDGCDAKYMISDDKVGPGGVKVRCKKCGHVTHVRRGEPAASTPEAGSAIRGEWWVAIDDQPVGPVGIEVVQHHWDLGEIGPESLVWYSGLAEWSPISAVPELHGHLGGGMAVAPPPPPPPAAAPPQSDPVPDDEWRPGAASALAALDEPEHRADFGPNALSPEDVAARDAPQAAPPPPVETTSAGTDPTGVVPLPMAGLERTTERRVATTPGARGPRARSAPPPEKESRSLAVVLLVALVVVVAAAAGLWWLTK